MEPKLPGAPGSLPSRGNHGLIRRVQKPPPSEAIPAPPSAEDRKLATGVRIRCERLDFPLYQALAPTGKPSAHADQLPVLAREASRSGEQAPLAVRQARIAALESRIPGKRTREQTPIGPENRWPRLWRLPPRERLRKLRLALAKQAAPSKDDDFVWLLGAGIVGVGLAMAYQNSEQRREAFLERLAKGLHAHGLAYASATFGRAAGNLPVWRVTLHPPDGGVRTQRVQLPAGTEPYADATCDEVIARVVADAS